MTRYWATLAYDGTAYQGFQRQADGIPSIQAAVEAAVKTVTGQSVTVIGAGRTDTGVHATGQVIAFDAEWKHDDEALLRALNVNLPGDIVLQDIGQHEGFHPRFDAVARVYRYTVLQAPTRQPLLRLRTWYVVQTLDFDLMQHAAEMLVGTHNFGAFGKPPRGENTERTVLRSMWTTAHLEPTQRSLLLTYTVEANAFLQHMVRRMVGLMVDVGRGALSLDDFAAVFQHGTLITSRMMAPPHGLVLVEVKY